MQPPTDSGGHEQPPGGSTFGHVGVTIFLVVGVEHGRGAGPGSAEYAGQIPLRNVRIETTACVATSSRQQIDTGPHMKKIHKSSPPSAQRGISALEYLVLAVVVIGVIAAAAALFGDDIEAAFTALGDLINPP